MIERGMPAKVLSQEIDEFLLETVDLVCGVTLYCGQKATVTGNTER